MFRTVQVPLWLLLLIVGFAAVTFASHFLFPSVRWFFRRRAERLVARLNERLTRPIEPFKLARRYDTIQRLTYDPKVIEAVAEYARENGVPEAVAAEKAHDYAREIVPGFSATAYFSIAIRAARWFARTLYHVRLGHFSTEALSAIAPNATVVFVMNHRSNMDYVLVTYLAASRTSLSYAVGEWARVWPLSGLIRSMGAYFIRRRARSPLYRRVLSRYVQIATAAGVTQAVFPEGGLSLDGRIAEPRLGILSYMTGAETPGRDVVFVPVAINYDRVLEDRFLVRAGLEGNRRFKVPVMGVMGYVLRRLWQKLTGRFLRYGYAAVSFGAPVSLAAFRQGREGDVTAALAENLMARIEAIMPVVPVPVLARVMLGAGAMRRDEIGEAFAREVEAFRGTGAPVLVPRGSAGLAAKLALDHLLLRSILEEDDGVIRVSEKDRPLLEYYAASIDRQVSAPAKQLSAPAGS